MPLDDITRIIRYIEKDEHNMIDYIKFLSDLKQTHKALQSKKTKQLGGIVSAVVEFMRKNKLQENSLIRFI